MRFQIYLDAQTKIRFRLVAKNGEIVCQSEAYETKAACLKGISAVKKAKTAKIDDTTK